MYVTTAITLYAILLISYYVITRKLLVLYKFEYIMIHHCKDLEEIESVLTYRKQLNVLDTQINKQCQRTNHLEIEV